MQEGSTSVLELEPFKTGERQLSFEMVNRAREAHAMADDTMAVYFPEPNQQKGKKKFDENKLEIVDRVSLGGSSSVDDLQWEHEMPVLCDEQNYHELEWDNYEQETLEFHNETSQLIQDIEDMAAKAATDHN